MKPFTNPLLNLKPDLDPKLKAELDEAKEQLLSFFDRFGDIYFWEPARKAKAVSLTAMLTNFFACINAVFVSIISPYSMSLNTDIAVWIAYFTGACAVYYLFLFLLCHVSYSLDKLQKLLLNTVLASLIVSLSVFSSMIGVFDSITWFIFFLYTALGFVLLDWRQVVITNSGIILFMIFISSTSGLMPFPVQAYLFAANHSVESMTFLDMLSAWTLTACAAFSGMWIMRFLLRNWHAQGIDHVSHGHLDPLTRVLKRRVILDALVEEANHAIRSDSALTLAVIDLDKFKLINAEHGHIVGDQILIKFASLLEDVTRRDDLVGRYGGQEFIVVFPHCSSAEAIAVLERLQESLLETDFEIRTKFTVSFSAGLCQLQVDDQKFENIIARADIALAKAKEQGGNQILLHDDI